MTKAIAFIFRPPMRGRRVFSFLRRDGDGKCVTVKDPRIDTLNSDLRSDPQSWPALMKRAEKLRDTFYTENDRTNVGPTPLSHNAEIFERFWTNYVETHRQHVDPNSAQCDFLRAINAVGNLSLLTATPQEIAATLKKYPQNKQRRLISRLKTIFKFIERDDGDELIMPYEIPPNPAVISREDFQRVLLFLDPTTRAVANTLAHTGLRVGELYDLREGAYRESDHTVLIVAQKREDGTHGPTKNRKIRRAYVMEAGRSDLKMWLGAADEHRPKRTSRFAERIKKACRQAGVKPLKAHDLRHCYVVWLLEAGNNLHVCARFIGDSATTCEKYYAGYITTPTMNQGVRE
jgi:integrase